MNSCLNCSALTSNTKFCSRSCSGFYASKNSKKPYKEVLCKSCNKLIGIGYKVYRKYCQECNVITNPNYVDWSKVTIKEHFCKLKTFQAHARIRSLARANFLKLKPEINYCQHCGYNKHYEVCHIKAISDFSDDTVISVVNEINNLISLCPNCHYEFDNNLKTDFQPLVYPF